MQVPTFEGDEDAGRGQRLVGRRVPESEAGQCQEGVDRPQTVQLHGGPTSSNSQGVFKNKKNKNKIKNRLCRDKEKKTPCQTQPATNTSVNLCDTSGSQGPVACKILVMQTCTELMSADLFKKKKGAKPLVLCAHFHLVKITFVFGAAGA